MRAVRGALRRLRVDWEAGLGRLPFFTQRTAVLRLGVLVATLAMLGGAAVSPSSEAAARSAPAGRTATGLLA